jgi:hypothetical protein
MSIYPDQLSQKLRAFRHALDVLSALLAADDPVVAARISVLSARSRTSRVDAGHQEDLLALVDDALVLLDPLVRDQYGVAAELSTFPVRPGGDATPKLKKWQVLLDEALATRQVKTGEKWSASARHALRETLALTSFAVASEEQS